MALNGPLTGFLELDNGEYESASNPSRSDEKIGYLQAAIREAKRPPF